MRKLNYPRVHEHKIHLCEGENDLEDRIHASHSLKQLFKIFSSSQGQCQVRFNINVIMHGEGSPAQTSELRKKGLGADTIIQLKPLSQSNIFILVLGLDQFSLKFIKLAWQHGESQGISNHEPNSRPTQTIVPSPKAEMCKIKNC